MTPLLVLVGTLLVLGLQPDPVPQSVANQDKLHHLLGFAALGFVTFMTFPRQPVMRLLIPCILLGLVIELGQGLQPLRTASTADMVANTLGVLLGWAGTWSLQAWRRMRQA